MQYITLKLLMPTLKVTQYPISHQSTHQKQSGPAAGRKLPAARA